MDLIVTGIFAMIVAIIAALIAVIKRKRIWRIITYAVAGLIVGLPLGYILAPLVISFL